MELSSCLKMSPSASEESDANASSTRLKKVRFDSLTIKEFPIALGDSVPHEGAPIGLGGKAQRSLVISMDHFEKIRPQRRPRKNLQIDSATRTDILLAAGHSYSEIATATITAHRVRISREETIRLVNKQSLSKMVDLTRKALKGMLVTPVKNSGGVAITA